MILLHSTPGAEEDKTHGNGTSSYLCLSEKGKYNTPIKVTEQKYTKIDDHPSVYMALWQPWKTK